MKTNTLMLSRGVRWSAVFVAALIGVMAMSLFAHAEAPSITASARTNAGATITSSAIGSNVYLNAVIASSSTSTLPTGSVDFLSYQGDSCQGNATLQAGVALTSGAATSSAIAMTAGGLSYKVHYSGDTYNVVNDTACQSVSATASTVSVTGTLSTTTAILAGSSVTESATLSGATGNAGGSVKYTVYSNNSCTTLWGNAGTKSVSNALAQTSDPFSFPIAGTYYWQVVYSGDSNNSIATSSCVALSVIATSTPNNPNPGNGTISGKVFNDANDNDMLDNSEAGVAGFIVNLYGQKGWWGNKGQYDPIKTVVTDASGNYSFGSLANGTYSIELIKKSGWKQTSDDFKSVVVSNNSFSDKNFAVQTKPSNENGNGNGHNGKDDKGKHYGWQNFLDRFGHLPWGQMKKDK